MGLWQNMIPPQDSTLLTMFSLNNTEIDFFAGISPDNYDKIRGRSLSTKEYHSRDLSMSSTKSLVVYHNRMEHNNNIVINDEMVDGSPTLPYETDQKKALHVSKVAELQDNMRLKHDNPNPINSNPQCIFSNEQHSIPTHGPTAYNEDVNVINIQLPYNPQASTEPELWSSNFHPISLHGSIEYIVSDAKNIKDSLNFMAWYISNKQVDAVRSNDLEDLKGIGEAVWNFISSVYQAK